MRALVLALLIASPLSAQHYQFIPAGHERTPSPMHELIYHAMEACTGQRGSYEQVSWWVANEIRDTAGQRVYGFWSIGLRDDGGTPMGRIIATQTEWANNPTLLSHEILHDLYEGVVPMDVANKCVIRHTGFPPGG